MAFNPMKLIELKSKRPFRPKPPEVRKIMGDLASSQIEEGTILEVTVKKAGRANNVFQYQGDCFGS